MKNWLSLLLALAACGAVAGERIEVCATERPEDGPSRTYKVEATLTTGVELNSATHSFNYAGWSKYVVIFWKQHQASVIELGSPILGIYPVGGQDQEGRKWDIAKSAGVCY